MRWEQGPRSGNVEDRRGLTLIRGGVGGGFGVLAIVIVAALLGYDPGQVLDVINGQTTEAPASAPGAPRPDDKLYDFSTAVLGQTEQVWTQVFAERGQRYEPPTLVVYDGITQTGCGYGQTAMGPFYCPLDRKLYLDLAFFREMDEKLGASGDFARAYVIAHEVGHHVQNLEGQMDEQAASERGAGGGSVRTELQADCYAGVWAARDEAAHKVLEPGDVEEALGAAAAVGDDRLQKARQGEVAPDSFTHGTSAQRVRWFQRGFAHGRMEDCDTFHAASL